MAQSISAPNALKLPKFLQRLWWVIDPIGYMEAAAKIHPDLFTAEVVGIGADLVFVSDPQAMQMMLTNDRKLYKALGEPNRFLATLLGNYSIVMLDQERHKRRRQLLMPPFHGDRMKAYGTLITNLTRTIFDQVAIGEPFSARQLTQNLSLQVILQAIFGVTDPTRAEHLKTQLVRVADTFRSPLSSSLLFFPALQKDWGPWSPWGHFLQQQQQLDDLIYSEIRDRRAHPDPERIDILSLLMTATDDTGQPMTDQELRDELTTLMFAGHETTATAMAWALYWIHHTPGVREKLLAELNQIDDSDPMQIVRSPYLSAVCNETLRIHPVGMLTFPRVVQEPTELLGYPLQPGTTLVGCIYLTHQREDLYPDHTQFKPERFLERQYTPYEFLPFGAGARRCIGEALAQFELKLAIATILRHYTLELATTKPEIPRRRGITLAPTRGVQMVLKAKRVPQAPPVMAIAEA